MKNKFKSWFIVVAYIKKIMKWYRFIKNFGLKFWYFFNISKSFNILDKKYNEIKISSKSFVVNFMVIKTMTRYEGVCILVKNIHFLAIIRFFVKLFLNNFLAPFFMHNSNLFIPIFQNLFRFEFPKYKRIT